jgi:O-antigen/teichoic acid export membrane protein
MMNTARRITTNFLSLATSEIISKILQLMVYVYLARHLGKENFGIFSFGLAFAFLVVIIADFGLSTLLIREISRDKKSASKYLSNAFASKILLSIITLVFGFVALYVMNYPPETKIIAMVMLSFTVAQSFTDLFSSIFKAFERMYYDAIIKVIRMVLLIGLVLYLIKSGYGLFASSIAFLIVEIFVFIITASIVYIKFIKVSFEFDYKFSKTLLKSSSLFCLSLVFSGLFMFIGSIILSKFRSTTEVGIYSTAANIMIALIFIPMMYGNAIYPVISRFYMTSKKSLKFAYEKSFKYMLMLGLPISAGIFALSDKIILTFYGSQYAEAAPVLAILCWHLFIRFLNIVSGFTLSSINRQGSRVFSQGIAALVNIILNFIFILVYGLLGAAIAAVITEVIFFFMYTYFINKYNLKISMVRLFVRPVIAGALMLVAISFIGNLYVAVIAGALVYAAALFTAGAIDKEDKIIIEKVIKNF